MKRALVILGVAILVASAGFAANSVVGSQHDLSAYHTGTNAGEVCVFCHTPHNALYDYPLWNHAAGAGNVYSLYTSATMNGDPQAFSNNTSALSSLCMSCHDGTVSVTAMWNPPNQGTVTAGIFVTGNALVGTDLTNDHPVNFDYDTSDAEDPEIQPVGNVPPGWLDGANFVQCSSCHDVHNNQYGAFLHISNTGSALCMECHIK